MTDPGATDFAVIVYREEDTWEAEVLPVALTEDLDGLVQALKQQPSVGGTIGLVAVGDDFFVALRVLGTQVSIFLSDVTAAVDWTLARQVLDYLGIPLPEDEELDQVLPVESPEHSPPHSHVVERLSNDVEEKVVDYGVVRSFNELELRFALDRVQVADRQGRVG